MDMGLTLCASICLLNEYNSLLIVDLDAPARYESAEVALNCGMMLRECLRHEPLARTVLFSEDFYCFFRYVELSTFDIASDAFASFKVGCTSTKHPKYSVPLHYEIYFQ